MSEQEIIETLRRLTKDLNDIGKSKVVELDFCALLVGDYGDAGGALTQWWRREPDKRRKAVLRELIQIVVKAHANHDGAVERAATMIPPLCDRLDPKELVPEGKKQPDTIPAENRSKAMQKRQAAKLYGQPVKWLTACMDDGTINFVKLSRQSYIFDWTKFPRQSQEKAKGD